MDKTTGSPNAMGRTNPRRQSIDPGYSHGSEEESPTRRQSLSLLPRRYSTSTPYALQPSFSTNLVGSASPLPSDSTLQSTRLSSYNLRQQSDELDATNDAMGQYACEGDVDNSNSPMASSQKARRGKSIRSMGVVGMEQVEEKEEDSLFGENPSMEESLSIPSQDPEEIDFDPFSMSIVAVGVEKMTILTVIPQLKQAGFRVHHTDRGTEALTMVSSGVADLLVISWHIPDMEVVLMLDILRNQLSSNIPVIVVSISDSPQVRAKAFSSGATDTLQLPITTENLMTSVSNILKSDWYARKYSREVDLHKSEHQTYKRKLMKASERERGYQQEIRKLQLVLQEKENVELRLRAAEAKIKEMRETITRLSFRLAVAEHGHSEWKQTAQINMTEAEKKIEDMKNRFTQAIETPMQSIIRTISELSQVSFFDRDKCRSQLVNAMKSLTSVDVYKPKMDLILETLPVDDMTKQWFKVEFSKDTTSIPSVLPNTLQSKMYPKIYVPTVSTLIESVAEPSAESELRKTSQSKGGMDSRSSSVSGLQSMSRSPSLGASGEVTLTRSPSSLERLSLSNRKSLSNPKLNTTSPVLEARSNTNPLRYRDDDYNLFDSTDGEIIEYCVNIFVEWGLHDVFQVPRDMLESFIYCVRKRYLPTPYHTFKHGFDVLHTCYQFIRHNETIFSILSPLNKLALYIAALCHDIEHPGVSNTFQISLLTPLALLYNDRSVLENHHCACTFNILRDPNCNILFSLNAEQYRIVRKQVIDMILSTDMSEHFTIVTQLSNRLNARVPLRDNQEDQLLLLRVLLHAADISNVAKSQTLSKAWGDLVFEEFLKQGDAEKKAGIPVSPYMDRNNTSQSKMVVGFIDFMVLPLFNLLSQLSRDGFEGYRQNLLRNRQFWSGEDSAETLPPISSTFDLSPLNATDKEIREPERREWKPSAPLTMHEQHHGSHATPTPTPKSLVDHIDTNSVIDFDPPKNTSHQFSNTGVFPGRIKDKKQLSPILHRHLSGSPDPKQPKFIPLSPLGIQSPTPEQFDQSNHSPTRLSPTQSQFNRPNKLVKLRKM
eukprot:TRINITY_DN8830_c0_g1_i1.p1 TRINITY_DN8830_c0_g1~~TRINITY_DN8830_c0_g1_i1.p1  ORF type:complete len:1057 (-),score=203.29 TRINITY_DN8830_c0_g1_i1:371-3541(-)